MNFKPGDFFLGIVDFLGVLVPGAVLVFLEAEWLHYIFGFSPLQTHWLVFACAAYIIGHLLLASTGILNTLAVPIARKTWFFSRIHKDADSFEKISIPLLGNAVTANLGTAFYSALSFVRLRNADAAAEIDRHMAGYKLLRTLMAVFLVDLALNISKWPKTYVRLITDFILILLFFMAFLRMLQWAHLLAFQYCILIHQQNPPLSAPPNATD